MDSKEFPQKPLLQIYWYFAKGSQKLIKIIKAIILVASLVQKASMNLLGTLFCTLFAINIAFSMRI